MQGGQTACWSRGGQVKPPGPGGEITARRLCRSPVPSQWALKKSCLFKCDQDDDNEMLMMSTCKWSMKTKGQLHNPVNSGRHTVAPVDHSHNLLSHNNHSIQAERESICNIWTLGGTAPRSPKPQDCRKKPVLEEENICNGEHWWASLAMRETPCRRCSWLPS